MTDIPWDAKDVGDLTRTVKILMTSNHFQLTELRNSMNSYAGGTGGGGGTGYGAGGGGGAGAPGAPVGSVNVNSDPAPA